MTAASASDHVARVFGSILKTARTGANLSQVDLATEVGASRTLIQLYERGKRQPTLGKVIDLADALGMQAHQLVQMTVARLRREAAHGD